LSVDKVIALKTVCSFWPTLGMLSLGLPTHPSDVAMYSCKFMDFTMDSDRDRRFLTSSYFCTYVVIQIRLVSIQ